MDILDNCETIEYERGNRDKYTNKYYDYDCCVTYKNGLIHSFNDQPAIKRSKYNGDYYFYVVFEEIWYKDGVIHRDNHQPARILYKLRKNSDEVIPDSQILYNNGRRYIVTSKGEMIYV